MARRRKKNGVTKNPPRIIPSTTEIRSDVQLFKPNLAMLESSELRKALVYLSVLGHAQNGHGAFQKGYPNVTCMDILLTAERTHQRAEKVRRSVTKHVCFAKRILEELLSLTTDKRRNIQKSPMYEDDVRGLTLRSRKGDTQFGGFHLFSPEKYTISDPLAFLRGAYIASQMDSMSRRIETTKTHPKTFDERRKLAIGGGTCHVGDLRAIRKKQVDMNDLSDDAKTYDEIRQLYNDKILIGRKNFHGETADKYNANMINVFVRETEGLGCCDDATLLGIGFLELDKNGMDSAVDAFHGAALIDTIDTLDKLAAFPITGGSDEYLGEYINARYKNSTGNDLVSDEEIHHAIAFGAKANTHSIKFSDSVRRFHELQRFNRRGHHITPIQAHINYLRTGDPTEGLELGFERTPSTKFYKNIESRLGRMASLGIVSSDILKRA